jgi:hypothetical protein
MPLTTSKKKMKCKNEQICTPLSVASGRKQSSVYSFDECVHIKVEKQRNPAGVSCGACRPGDAQA